MEFLPVEIIRKKRFRQAHTRSEIHFMLGAYTDGRIPDYQMSAWLMAICLSGMNLDETIWLTEEMRDSGKILDLTHLGMTVDKHSTGGVGDKVSLILAPLVAAAGVPVPMIAGRGLGHTGGTLDKLESISGFSVQLTFSQFEKQVAQIGTAIMGQSIEICPADRKLYALRDVTGTIDSLPLICGSIMSKKLAEGMMGLVLDVKYGSGAFMKTLPDAESLAQLLMKTGQRAGKKVMASLTRMHEPLGRFVGNALEVKECLKILARKKFAGIGKSYSDTEALTLHLAGQMIFLGGKSSTPEEGVLLAQKLLDSGAAEEKFRQLCQQQGGDLTQPLSLAKESLNISAETSGYMHYLDVEKIGLAALVLGAGRQQQTDRIDHSAGIEVFRQQGETIERGGPLFTLFASRQEFFPAAVTLIRSSFTISPQPYPQFPLIAKVLT